MNGVETRDGRCGRENNSVMCRHRSFDALIFVLLQNGSIRSQLSGLVTILGYAFRQQVLMTKPNEEAIGESFDMNLARRAICVHRSKPINISSNPIGRLLYLAPFQLIPTVRIIQDIDASANITLNIYATIVSRPEQVEQLSVKCQSKKMARARLSACCMNSNFRRVIQLHSSWYPVFFMLLRRSSNFSAQTCVGITSSL